MIQLKKFGEVCDFVRGPFGGSLKKSCFVEDGYAVYEQQHAIYDQFSEIRYFVDEDKFNEMKRFELKPNDLIMSCSGTMGKVAIVPENVKKGIINQALLKLTPKDFLDVQYLKYWMSSPDFEERIEENTVGAAIKNVASVKVLKQIDVPIPPLPEQKQIVAILDKAFAAIDQAQTNIEKNIENAKELFQSKLNEIFSQKGDGWEVKTLGEIGTLTSSKRIFKKEYVKKGVPFYRSKEIKELGNRKEISLELFISEERYEEIKEKFGIPKQGDVLLTAVGTIGEMYVVQKDDKFYFKDGNIMWLKDFEALNSYYLKYALSNYVEQLNSMSKGSAYSALTISTLKKYSIPVPSESKQIEIVNSLDELKRNTIYVETQYQQKLDNLEDLKKSILQKAFSGGLTVLNHDLKDLKMA